MFATDAYSGQYNITENSVVGQYTINLPITSEFKMKSSENTKPERLWCPVYVKYYGDRPSIMCCPFRLHAKVPLYRPNEYTQNEIKLKGEKSLLCTEKIDIITTVELVQYEYDLGNDKPNSTDQAKGIYIPQEAEVSTIFLNIFSDCTFWVNPFLEMNTKYIKYSFRSAVSMKRVPETTIIVSVDNQYIDYVEFSLLLMGQDGITRASRTSLFENQFTIALAMKDGDFFLLGVKFDDMCNICLKYIIYIIYQWRRKQLPEQGMEMVYYPSRYLFLDRYTI